MRGAYGLLLEGANMKKTKKTAKVEKLKLVKEIVRKQLADAQGGRIATVVGCGGDDSVDGCNVHGSCVGPP